MTKSKFTEEQIIGCMQQVEADLTMSSIGSIH